MASAATIPEATSLYEPVRLLTIADVAALPSNLPSGAVRYELIDGRLVVMAPPGVDHSGSQVRFGHLLFSYGAQQNWCETFTEVGVILRRAPDTLVGPDVAVVVRDRLPPRLSREGYLETIPDLVVEIRSKNDKPSEIDNKVREYLSAGVRLVWIADPIAMTVTEYRQSQSPRVLAADETLTADDVVPGFSMKVRDGFR